MKRTILLFGLFLFSVNCFVFSNLKDQKLNFKNTEYFHRWSQNGQHEFTPKGQEDLEKWSDMVTINVYSDAKDGDGLASIANAVLGNYQNAGAKILKTDSVPRTAQKEAEHFISAIFPQPRFIEVVFAHLKMVDGVGCAVIYSHRIYGEKAGNEASAWLRDNGQATEQALMSWEAMPSLADWRN